MQYTRYAGSGSNKVFNVPLRRKCLPTPGVNYRIIPGYCSQQIALLYLLPPVPWQGSPAPTGRGGPDHS